MDNYKFDDYINGTYWKAPRFWLHDTCVILQGDRET